MAFRQLQPGSIAAKFPLHSASPLRGNGIKVEHHNAKAQLAVQFRGEFIRALNQTDLPIMKHKAIGLAVQIAGGKACRMESLPQYIVKESN